MTAMQNLVTRSISIASLLFCISASNATDPQSNRFDSLLRTAPLTGEQLETNTSRFINIPTGARYSMSELTLTNTELLQIQGTFELGRLMIETSAQPSIECSGTFTVFGDIILADNAILNIEGNMIVLGSVVSGQNSGIVIRSGGIVKIFGDLTGASADNVMGGGALVVKGLRSSTVSGFESLGPRPSDLVTFTTENNGGAVTIKWSSRVNICSKEFLVQKSPDGILYVDLFSVPSNTRGSAVGHYSIVDDEPYTGTSFYRLKQSCDTSFLGFSALTVGYSYSPFKGMTIYPNPLLKQLEIYFPGQFNNVKLRLEDSIGVVQPCSIDFLPPFFSVATESIPTGIYYINIEADGKTERHAVSILN